MVAGKDSQRRVLCEVLSMRFSGAEYMKHPPVGQARRLLILRWGSSFAIRPSSRALKSHQLQDIGKIFQLLGECALAPIEISKGKNGKCNLHAPSTPQCVSKC
jgi:hypothetical protein